MTADDEQKLPVKNGGARPVPDPTELTDRAIARSERTQKEYIDGQLAVRDERLKGIDTATSLLRTTTDAVPVLVKDEVGHLKELTNERFEAAERQRLEQKKDTKDAVDAALSAAKEAVKEQTTASGLSITKSEAATNEKITKLEQLFTTNVDALADKIDDLKERVADVDRNARDGIGTLTTTVVASAAQRGGSREGSGDVRVLILAIFSVAGGIVGIVGLILAVTR